jgi:hypothetical protein
LTLACAEVNEKPNDAEMVLAKIQYYTCTVSTLYLTYRNQHLSPSLQAVGRDKIHLHRHMHEPARELGVATTSDSSQSGVDTVRMAPEREGQAIFSELGTHSMGTGRP